MISKKDFVKINDYLWEIPSSFWNEMKVPARIYAPDKILEASFEDESIKQLINTSTLPGVFKFVLAMPDIHEGYGPPIGGIIATKYPEGAISPGAIGFDQNCGVRLLLSEYKFQEIKDSLEKLAQEIQNQVPSGLGQGRKQKTNLEEMEKILNFGAKHLVDSGFGQKEDLENCESFGCLNSADSREVSFHAKKRGMDQVGTLGSGNHFLEIQKVEEIFNETIATQFGIFKDQIVIMIHTGSRGLGHQICTDYLKTMISAIEKYKIKLPDRELACAPFNSDEGQKFFKAMCCGANFAWANRQMISYYVGRAWEKVLGNGERLKLLYDVAHNIAKIEEHFGQKLIVHRKGATRAFPPNHPELSEKYKITGQPVIIPGSMGTSSYVLAGVESGKDSFFSTNHGAGRKMSRKSATRNFSGEKIIKDLSQKGIIVKCRSYGGIAEEAPQAYKNIDEIVGVVHQAGLSQKVARLVPLAVIKGE
jgi:tRNA-splicing ligase RtcB